MTETCRNGHDRSLSVRDARGRWRCRPCAAKQATDRNRRYRDRALAAYGGKCACCGEAERAFLCFDHVEGGGGARRKTGEDHPGKLPLRLHARGYPPGYRVLCHNCNWAIHSLGSCPHGEAGVRAAAKKREEANAT